MEGQTVIKSGIGQSGKVAHSQRSMFRVKLNDRITVVGADHCASDFVDTRQVNGIGLNSMKFGHDFQDFGELHLLTISNTGIFMSQQTWQEIGGTQAAPFSWLHCFEVFCQCQCCTLDQCWVIARGDQV